MNAVTKQEKIGLMVHYFGPGQEGITCGSCNHLCTHWLDKKYYKCEAYGLSSSEATDWGKSWPSCGMYSETEELPKNFRTIMSIKKHAPRPSKVEHEIDGQISMMDLLSP